MFKRVPKGPKQVEVTRSTGCCNCFGKALCCVIIGLLLFITFVCSLIAVLICRFQFWTYVSDPNAKGGPLTLRTGWLEFTRSASDLNITSLTAASGGNSSIVSTTAQLFTTPSAFFGAGSPPLRDISWDFGIIGYICLGVLLVSIVLSFFMAFAACCGRAGLHLRCLGIPVGIALVGMQLAYYLCALFKVRDYTYNLTQTAYTPIPDVGWILGVIAGILWLICAASSSCVPATTRTDWVEVQSPEGAMIRPQSPGYDPEKGTTGRVRR